MKKEAHEAQSDFLSAYIKSGGNITRSAFLVGITRQSHYDWLGSDPTYAERFEVAHQAVCDAIEDEIKRRGQEGYDEPIVYKGQITKDEEGNPVCVRRFSDVLLIVRAKALMPEKYRERSEVKNEHSGTVKVEHSGSLGIVDQRRTRLLGRIGAERERRRIAAGNRGGHNGHSD